MKRDHANLIIIAGISIALPSTLFIGLGASPETSVIAIPAVSFLFFEMGIGIWLGIDEEKKKYKPKESKTKKAIRGLKITTIIFVFLIAIIFSVIIGVTVSTMTIKGWLILLPITIGCWALLVFLYSKWTDI